MALDMYQKIKWAEEEIIWLNIEIHHFLAYIHDKDTFIQGKIRELHTTDAALAYQILIHHEGHTHFNAHHIEKVTKLSQDPRFTGDISGLGSGLQDASFTPNKTTHPWKMTGDTNKDANDKNEANSSDEDVDKVTATMDVVLTVSAE